MKNGVIWFICFSDTKWNPTMTFLKSPGVYWSYGDYVYFHCFPKEMMKHVYGWVPFNLVKPLVALNADHSKAVIPSFPYTYVCIMVVCVILVLQFQTVFILSSLPRLLFAFSLDFVRLLGVVRCVCCITC